MVLIILFYPEFIYGYKMPLPPIDCHVNDALEQISRAEYGFHYIIIYANLFTLIALYSAFLVGIYF